MHNNASTQDVVTKRIPLDKIKPELLEKHDELVTEFCRGVWSGWGHESSGDRSANARGGEEQYL